MPGRRSDAVYVAALTLDATGGWFVSSTVTVAVLVPPDPSEMV